MAFRGKRLRVDLNPVRDGWIPCLWHGGTLIACYETESTRDAARRSGHFQARKWFNAQRARPVQGTLWTFGHQ